MNRVWRKLGVVLVAATAAGCTVDDLGGLASRHGSVPADGGVSADGGVCVPEHTVPIRITSGDESIVGTFTIQTSDEFIDVLLLAEPGWGLGDTYVVIGVNNVFTSFTENETPWVDGYLDEIRIRIPIADLGLSCGDTFKLIVQLHVLEESTGVRYFASAVGSLRYSPPENGWKEYYQICCEEEEEQEGCAFTQGYWKNHPEAWPVESLTLGGQSYTQAELIAILETPPAGDASLILAHQLIAAMLNVASGASSVSAIGDAQAWLSANCASGLPCGVASSTTAGAEAVAISEQLTMFNEGQIGPGHCEDKEDSETSDGGVDDGVTPTEAGEPDAVMPDHLI